MYNGKAIYTAPELEILKSDYFGLGAATKCQQLIREQLGIERSLQSLQTKARRMGLQRDPRIYTEAEEEILRLNYFGLYATKKCKRLIRERLGIERSIMSIQAKVQRMNLQTNLASRGWDKWNKTEDSFLVENAQKHDIKWLAKNMPRRKERKQRTEHAISRRCKFLRINRLAKDGWYTLGEVAGMFGSSRNTIKKLAEEKTLKGEKRKGEIGDHIWEFQRVALHNFVVRYPMFFNGRRCDMVQIIDLASSNGIYYRTDAI
jgi:hypothetical protein